MTGIAILECYPDIRALGCDRLQELADRWVSTPVAKECFVTAVRVAADFSIGFDAATSHDVQERETFFFPADDLVRFMVTEGIDSPELRERLLADVAAGRARVGPRVFQHFELNAQPLYITCRNPGCRNIMQRNVPASSRMEEATFTGECPRCGRRFEYSTAEFRANP